MDKWTWVVDKLSPRSSIQKEIDQAMKVIQRFEVMAEVKFAEAAALLSKTAEAKKLGNQECAELSESSAQILLNAANAALHNAYQVEKRIALIKAKEAEEKSARWLRKVTGKNELAAAKPTTEVLAAKAGFSKTLENLSQDNEMLQRENPMRGNQNLRRYSSTQCLDLKPINEDNEEGEGEEAESAELRPVPRPRARSFAEQPKFFYPGPSAPK